MNNLSKAVASTERLIKASRDMTGFSFEAARMQRGPQSALKEFVKHKRNLRSATAAFERDCRLLAKEGK